MSIGFRGREIACLAAALGRLACLAAALGPLAAALGPLVAASLSLSLSVCQYLLLVLENFHSSYIVMLKLQYIQYMSADTRRAVYVYPNLKRAAVGLYREKVSLTP